MINTYKIKILLKYTRNPISTFLVYSGRKNETTCKLKDNLGEFKYSQSNKEVLGSLLDSLEKINNDNCGYEKGDITINDFIKQLDNDIIIINGVKYTNKNISVLFEKLFENPYDLIKFENRTVIDIGANIGDTTLDFANKGAKEVYAFEPLKPIYDVAIENINLNENIKDKIHMYNEAISGKKRKLELYYSGSNSTDANTFKKSNESYEIETTTFNSILEKYNIEPDILKLDCEGCEYSIINNSDLSMFNEIILEYHTVFTGISHDCIVNNLKEQGFNVELYPAYDSDPKDVGIIYAFKN